MFSLTISTYKDSFLFEAQSAGPASCKKKEKVLMGAKALRN